MPRLFLIFLLLISSPLLWAQEEIQWLPRNYPSRSKGRPVIFPWHTGTAGIIKNDGAELSLFNASRIGMTEDTELLYRLGEEWFLPNVGLKHRWWKSDRLALSSEHNLYYLWPFLKMVQTTGIKGFIPDTLPVKQGIAMRHELLFSWLINPQSFGCPDPASEKILTFRVGIEFYAGQNNRKIQPFRWLHSLYHTQILQNRNLYYAGVQFDSYVSSLLHYSANALYYSVDFTQNFAVESNLRLTYYISSHIGISASFKAAYMKIPELRATRAFPDNLYTADYIQKARFSILPLVDVTYLIRPDRGGIQHGLFGNR